MRVDLQARVAAFLPAQRQQFAAQRQHAVFAGLQRCRQALALVLAQLQCQPVAVLFQEAFAHHQACARRQGQACTAFVHAQLDAARTRIAHAQYLDLGILQAQANGVALYGGGRGRADQAAQQTAHAPSIAPLRAAG